MMALGGICSASMPSSRAYSVVAMPIAERGAAVHVRARPRSCPCREELLRERKNARNNGKQLRGKIDNRHTDSF
ncbi:hypothetical protein BDU57DRAFT_516375 [Ampelomyces quisqualis]|uniref:Uncharacterized protein n=1 Tax=Ampelomyces quisqualis TaxID=50730 RepID=A0A6A5QLN9_AMPQU|nr:hypothetical protein BDU57DRAFT_516375 [Ampelomyces quisqualis]